MAAPNSQTNAINIGPDAGPSNHTNLDADRAFQMTSGSVGSAGGDAYSPPTITYTAAADDAPAGTVSNMDGMGLAGSSSNNATGGQWDRRHSDEWDASKVPPSRFQKRKGSIYSTQGSRDGHVDSNYAAKFHAKHAELGYNKLK
ncbi:uncharacterized protein SPSK_08097 [Sporothrix schenckii 1099-18]|uniref:Uncharacterized protein n=2 Tax=Sporothrix schenckii TaxID=29908 RepID=U7PYW9_SPOS1|nr:uncharacterized protein SPSK_08097 [Sporothrix schenckii 1099-18]ERT00803.1 hypothetical protein HMPREF1624_02036 [Sporothrix schenckii ATCC 58251]KJR87892.1 hypothetical protein SPSK_08097 [Sporothrix schenckii 1099-18]